MSACLTSQDLQDLPASCTRRDIPPPSPSNCDEHCSRKDSCYWLPGCMTLVDCSLDLPNNGHGSLGGMQHNGWEVGGEKEGLCQAHPLCEGYEEPLGKYPIGQKSLNWCCVVLCCLLVDTTTQETDRQAWQFL